MKRNPKTGKSNTGRGRKRPKEINQAPLPKLLVGVDVGKSHIVVADNDPSCRTQEIVNRARNLKRWLEKLPAGAALVMESTGEYHLLLANLAHGLGFQVYVVSPGQVHHFRKSSPTRAKTDRVDAFLIVDFGLDMWRYLRLYVPLSPHTLLLNKLLRQRGQIVKAHVALEQSLRLPEAAQIDQSTRTAHQLDSKNALDGLKIVEQRFTAQILSVIQADAGLKAAYDLLVTIPGIGEVIAPTILAALGRAQFSSASAFVGYTGLDPIANDSGEHTGRRRLSKRGDPFLRQMLFMAARGAANCKWDPQWTALYHGYCKRMDTTQAYCILARRIATVAWCVLKKGQPYDPARLRHTLTAVASA